MLGQRMTPSSSAAKQGSGLRISKARTRKPLNKHLATGLGRRVFYANFLRQISIFKKDQRQ